MFAKRLPNRVWPLEGLTPKVFLNRSLQMAIMSAQQALTNARTEYYEWEESASQLTAKGLLTEAVADPMYLIRLDQKLSEGKRLYVHPSSKKISRDMFLQLLPLQRKILGKLAKRAWYGTTIVHSAVEKVKSAPVLKELLDIASSAWPERVKHYMMQSRRCYQIGAYDGSIVMASRAVEFTIKDYLTRNQESCDETDTLGTLVAKLKSLFGRKKPLEHEKTLEKLGDVVRLHRNITAHDNPQIAGKEDADLIWASAIYTLKHVLESSVPVAIT